MAMTAPTPCAYCGIPSGNVTREHVVPSTLWGGRGFLPQHPVIVKVCDGCKLLFDKDAEYFRNCLIAMMDRGSHPVTARLLTSQVIRSLERNRKSMADMFKGMRFLARRTPSGIVAGTDLAFEIDVNRLNRIIEKIIRGIYYHKCGTAFPPTHEVRVFIGASFWQDQGFQNLLATMCPAEHQGDDVFYCRYTRDECDPELTAWLLVFYGKMGFFAWTPRIEPHAGVPIAE